MLIGGVTFLVVICVLLVLALCRASGEADRQEEVRRLQRDSSRAIL
jgi:hypothetical protein